MLVPKRLSQDVKKPQDTSGPDFGPCPVFPCRGSDPYGRWKSAPSGTEAAGEGGLLAFPHLPPAFRADWVRLCSSLVGRCSPRHRASEPAPLAAWLTPSQLSACLTSSLLSGLRWNVTSSEKLSLTSLENWKPHQASIFNQSYLSLVWNNHENVEFIFLRLEAQKKKKTNSVRGKTWTVFFFPFCNSLVRFLTSHGANGAFWLKQDGCGKD